MEDEFNTILTPTLDDLYWLINDDPEPNWRETYPIWQLARMEDSPSHVAWKIWDGYMHAIVYTIDHEQKLTIIRWAIVERYPLPLPSTGLFG